MKKLMKMNIEPTMVFYIEDKKIAPLSSRQYSGGSDKQL